MQMVDDNVGNRARQNAVQNDGNEVGQNAVQNSGIQNVKNMNRLSVVLEISNQYGNGNVVTTPTEGNGNGINGNPIRCYNCRGEGHYASNCIVKSRKRDVAYLQQQLQIAQEEEARIQSTQEEFEFQASTSGTQSDNAPIYDSNGSTEVPKDENCYDHDIFNMLTHEVQYTDLQTELDRTKEKLKNCIINKEKEYAVLWNNGYTKCEECKYDKISYDKAYNDMQQKIERLQAQLGDLKGKSCDTQCASNTLDPLFQKLEDEKVSLESQVLNYAKENAHLKTTYKNLFDSIKVTQAQTNSIIDSLQKQLYDTIYDNAKLRAQLFDKVSERKGTTKGTRTNTMFTKQSILGKPPSSSYKPKLYFSVTPFPKSSVLPKVDKTNALSKPVTSNSAPSTRELKVVQTVNVIAPRIFRSNPSKTSRIDNVVPNKPVKTSVRIKPITVSQPNVIHKQQANSDLNGFSSTRVNNTAKTRRPHPRSNSNADRVPSKCKSSCLSNNVEKIEEKHRNSQIPKNQKHMSSECNNITLAIRNAKSKIVCVMCKQCLVTANHDVCVLNYINNMNSRADNQSANVIIRENQKRYKTNAKNLKELGSKGSLDSSRPSKPRTCLRWIPTGRIFAMCGKLTASSNTENKFEKSMYDNASTSNPSEPSSKGFLISTSLHGSWKVYSVICSTNYSNGENQVVLKSSAVTTADASDKRQQQQDSTSSTSTLATTITADGNFDFQNRRDLPRSTLLDRVEVLDEVSSDDNEVTEVKALMDLTDEEIVYVSKESVRNGEWIKISLKKHVNIKILKENQNLRNELKELTSISKAWLNSSNKVNQYISEQITTQKKKILGIDQVTKDTSNSGPKDPVFVKSSTDNSKVSITDSNKPKLSKAEDSTLSNHDTGKLSSNESQRNTTDHSVVVSNSPATDYNLADKSLICSTPFLY
ncbi:reverse transcriptase domain-containing protein [Tanacetum coccineum]